MMTMTTNDSPADGHELYVGLGSRHGSVSRCNNQGMTKTPAFTPNSRSRHRPAHSRIAPQRGRKYAAESTFQSLFDRCLNFLIIGPSTAVGKRGFQ
jgi:hypothetical protein